MIARACALLLAALLAAAAFAHQQKASVTRVLFNPRTGNIEVMHRFLVHDIEHASATLFGAGADILGSDSDRARFAAYVHSGFSLTNQDGQRIELSPLGHELDGKHLWVYAEAPIPDNLSALTLVHDALRDVWPQQRNLVNVERDKNVRSATFEGGRSEITIDLTGAGARR